MYIKLIKTAIINVTSILFLSVQEYQCIIFAKHHKWNVKSECYKFLEKKKIVLLCKFHYFLQVLLGSLLCSQCAASNDRLLRIEHPF